jgi:hypothetical protein
MKWRDEMGSRRIAIADIEATLAAPDRVPLDPVDPTLTRSFTIS